MAMPLRWHELLVLRVNKRNVLVCEVNEQNQNLQELEQKKSYCACCAMASHGQVSKVV